VKEKMMPDEKFKMPLSSYEELAKVIQAYGSVSQPSNLEDISKSAGLHPTIISRNAGFLISVGILEPGSKKIATELGHDLARALEHGVSTDISSCWRQAILQTDFLQKLLTAINIRKGMDNATLESHITYSAGQPKKPSFMTGARTIIEILSTAGMIDESDGKYVIAKNAEWRASTPSTSKGLQVPATESVVVSEVAGVHPAKASTPYQLQIHLNVSCTPTDLEIIGPKLRNLMKELSEDFESKSSDKPE
jgi:hypothetical protein